MLFGLGKSKDTALLEAAAAGDAAKVREILCSDVSLVGARVTKNTQKTHPDYEEGATALHLAARHGHRRVAELLISLKASITVATAAGRTPLHCAAAGHEGLVELLIDSGAAVDPQDAKGRRPLHEAAAYSADAAAKLLIESDANAFDPDNEGNTPLHYAAKSGSRALVAILLASGADANCVNHQNRTPLHMAVIGVDHTQRGQFAHEPTLHREAVAQVIKILVKAGAKVNTIDQIGETPLDILTYLEGVDRSDPLVGLLRSYGGQWHRYRQRALADERAHGTAQTIAPPAYRPTHHPETHHEGDHDEPIHKPRTVATGVSPAHSHTDHDNDRGNAIPPIELGEAAILFGRDPDCNVRLKSLTFSHRHARIELTPRGYVITDLGSHNGTQVNGMSVGFNHELHEGDHIRMGLYDFRFDGHRLIALRGEISDTTLAAERRQAASRSQRHDNQGQGRGRTVINA